jgi:hypothetical protein
MSATAPMPRPRRRWIWVTVAIITAIVVVLPVGARLWLKGEIQHQAEPLTIYSQPITELVVHAPGVDVSISRGGGSQVIVARTISWLFTRPSVRQVRRGHILMISASCQPNVFEDCQVSLGVQVPARMTVQAAVGSGTIAVSGLTGQLTLKATSGAITMTDIGGPVRASVTSGSLIAYNLSSPQLDASADSGSLSMSFVNPPQLLELTVGAGSATATMPPGSRYRVSGHRGPGLLNIARGLSDVRSAQVIRASVGAGLLAIAYPP